MLERKRERRLTLIILTHAARPAPRIRLACLGRQQAHDGLRDDLDGRNGHLPRRRQHRVDKARDGLHQPRGGCVERVDESVGGLGQPRERIRDGGARARHGVVDGIGE